MGTVKYSGPVASFHCPTEATIRSLKVHFSPKQLGSGDPSPENVREIEGWDKICSSISGTNLADTSVFMLNKSISWGGQKETYGNFTTTNYHASFLFHIPRGATLTLTCHNSDIYWVDRIIPVKYDSVDWSSGFLGYYNYALYNNVTNRLTTRTWTMPEKADGLLIRFRMVEDIAITQELFDNLKISCVIGSIAPEVYEPYHGSTTNYEFGVLGKNKFNWDVPVSESSPVTSDTTTAREFTLDTYIIGMSVNNYYRQNYANWVLNPSVENGVISFSSGGASGYGIAFPIKLAAGQTYFLSGTGDGAVGATYYNENGELISYQNNRLNKTITVPENAATTLIGFYANTSNTDFTFSNIQLELGSSATTYEPYNPNKTVYGGWVDLISGEVCEEWGEYIFTGDEDIKVGSWNMGEYTDGQFYRITYSDGVNGNPFCSTTTNEETKCNILKSIASSYYGVKAGIISVLGGKNGVSYRYIVWGKSGFGDTVEDCVSKLRELYNNGTPLTVVSKLADPYINTYYIAPTALKTFLGHNNVWSNADYVEVEYDLHETQNILARKQFIIANQPHVVKPAAAPLQNFVTDLAAPLKECKVYFSPVQEGTGVPSPDNVRPISGWTEIKLFRAGKNLMSDNHVLVGAQFKNVDGNYKIDTANIYKMLSIDVPKNTSLHIHKETASGSELGLGNEIAYYGAPAIRIGSMTYYTNRDFNTDNYSYAYLMIGKDQAIDNPDVLWQVEVGNAATIYEAPKGTTEIVANWTTEAGTVYGGYVDLINGEIVQEWYTISIDETASMRVYTPDARNQGTYCEASYWLSTFNAPNAASYEPYSTDGYCNILPYIENNYTNEARATAYNSVAAIYLSGVKTQEEYLAWIAEYGPIIICYRLATPIHYTLTPTQLKTLRGTNNIWAANGGDNIEIAYWKH